MKLELAGIEINAGAVDAYQQLSSQRQQTLMAPEDDMWATFADLANPYSLTLGTRLVGRFSVDDDNQLHGFYVCDEFEELADELFTRVVNDLGVSAAMASTVDPAFLSRSLTAGGPARSVALMYDYVAQPASDEVVEVRLATRADHAAAVVFYQAETGGPEAFLAPYLGERIDSGELYLVEAEGQIAATGERRVDKRAPGNAHLGLVVGTELRGQGMGSRLMNTLTKICIDGGMIPRCSTEPTNKAAQTVIRRAGFRNRHQTFAVALTEAQSEP